MIASFSSSDEGERPVRSFGDSGDMTLVSACSQTVDILLATYNGEKYLPGQLESLRGQTYANWRLLFSDDGSSDSTPEIIRAECGRDSRMFDVSTSTRHRSALKNFLYLLSKADADFVMFCDQDDVWLPDKIERSLQRMQELGNSAASCDVPLLVYGDCKVVNQNLELINPSFVSTLSFSPYTITLAQLLVSNVVQGCTIMMNRALVEQVLTASCWEGFDYHDHIVAAVAMSTGLVSFISEPLLLYRQHEGNEVGVNSNPSLIEKLKGGLRTTCRSNWLEAVTSDETAFSVRAKTLLNCNLPIAPSCKDLLMTLADYRDYGITKRLSLIFRYGLLRPRGLYGKACQLVGLLLA